MTRQKRPRLDVRQGRLTKKKKAPLPAAGSGLGGTAADRY